MDTTQKILSQVDEFRAFVLNHVAQGDQSIDELYDEWRLANPTPTETEVNVRAIAASLRDLDSGNSGRPVDEFLIDFKTNRGSK